MFVICLLLLALTQSLPAREKISVPVVSIIIDDIGYRLREDEQAIALPGPLAYAVMPHSPFANKMALMARQHGKDVIVHLPMEAQEEQKNRFLGPGALTLDMTVQEFTNTLDKNITAIPGAIGVNNHMGSLLTRHPGHMHWLMQTLHEQGKFYIDSVTSRHSVARLIARENAVPYLRRDVFLDNEHAADYINTQFDELVKVAKRKGHAIAIGHPHPETISVLAGRLQQLDKLGIKLISIRQMVGRENGETLQISSLQPPSGTTKLTP